MIRTIKTYLKGAPFYNALINSTTGLAVNPTASTCSFSSQLPESIPTPNGPIQGLNPVALFYLNSYPLPNYISPLSGCPMGKDGFPLIPVVVILLRSKRVASNTTGRSQTRGKFYAFGTGILGGVGNIALYKSLNMGGKASIAVPLSSVYKLFQNPLLASSTH
jgi:hypothetical protein